MRLAKKLVIPAFLIVAHLFFISSSIYCLQENQNQSCCCHQKKSEPQKKITSLFKLSASKSICALSENKNANDQAVTVSFNSEISGEVPETSSFSQLKDFSFLTLKESILLTDNPSLSIKGRAPPVFI